ncbi:MAG: tyrosine-protein kinase domain-containing protein [Mycobacteriales bacterium]
MTVAGYLAVLRRRAVLIVPCIILGLVVAVLLNHRDPKLYRSAAQLYVRIPFSTSVFASLAGVQLASTQLDTYAAIADGPVTALQVAGSLGVPVTQLGTTISAAPQPATFLLNISASGPSPARVVAVANAAATVVSGEIAQLSRTTGDKISAVVLTSASPAGAPYSPRSKRNEAVGLVVGLLVGLLLAIGVESLDRAVREAGQVERGTGLALLGALPRYRSRRRRASAVGAAPDSVLQAYRTLRAALRFAGGEELHTVLVTSAGRREGRTTVVAQLAFAFARAGERVAVLDADLREPGLAAALGVPPTPGWTSVLAGEAQLSEVLVRRDEGLAVLPAGPPVANPAEVLGSRGLADLLSDAARDADIVLIDSPPVLTAADAIYLAPVVDAVLVVVRANRSRLPAVVEAVRRLTRAGAPLIGFVYNAGSARTAMLRQPAVSLESSDPIAV